MTKRERKIAGVMGGMGPDATVDFMAKVIALTDSGRDQDHVHMIVDQDPTVPNRQVAIESGVDDVSQRLTQMARRLETAGADFLVMVCNTAHIFADSARESVGIPFISIIAETVKEIDRLYPAARNVGLMATAGCIDTGIYQAAISESGRTALVPDAAIKIELMQLINAVKAGDQSDQVRTGMESVASALVSQGADVIIAGCTEIPIVFAGDGFSVPVVASTNVLARRTVEFSLGLSPLPNN